MYGRNKANDDNAGKGVRSVVEEWKSDDWQHSTLHPTYCPLPIQTYELLYDV